MENKLDAIVRGHIRIPQSELCIGDTPCTPRTVAVDVFKIFDADQLYIYSQLSIYYQFLCFLIEEETIKWDFQK